MKVLDEDTKMQKNLTDIYRMVAEMLRKNSYGSGKGWEIVTEVIRYAERNEDATLIANLRGIVEDAQQGKD